MGKLFQLFAILSIICLKIQTIYSADNLYTSEQKNVYYIDNQYKYTWFDALTKCTSMNMSLVTIDTKEKSDDITNLLSKTFGVVNGMWIGAIANGKDHHYIWISNGNEITFSNWSPGEPNFQNSQEYCVLTGWTDKIKWNDGGCYSLQGLICEFNDYSHKQDELKELYEEKLQEELTKEQQLQNILQEELTKDEELENQLQKELENEEYIKSQLQSELEKEQGLQTQLDKNELLLQMILDFKIDYDRRNKLLHDVVVNIN